MTRSHQVVLLDSIVSTVPDTFRAAALLDDGGHLPARWRQSTSDSLILQLAVWPAGKSYQLRPDSVGWVGLATYETSELVRTADGQSQNGVMIYIVSAVRSACHSR